MNNPFYGAHTLKNRIHYRLVAMLVLAYPTFFLLVKGANSIIFTVIGHLKTEHRMRRIWQRFEQRQLRSRKLVLDQTRPS